MKKLMEILKAKRTRKIGLLILILAMIIGSIVWHKNFINDDSDEKSVFIHQSIEHITGGLILCDHCSMEKDSDSITIKTDIGFKDPVVLFSYWDGGVLVERGYED